jgi:CheY-like chemotaxis protein
MNLQLVRGKSFAKDWWTGHFALVTQPLALIFYRKLLPGSTLANRLRDLNYRVHAAASLAELVNVAQTEGPMVVLVEVEAESRDTIEALRSLHGDPRTGHVPILAFAEDEQHQASARAAGATLAASAEAVNSHFDQLLEQVLRLD